MRSHLRYLLILLLTLSCILFWLSVLNRSPNSDYYVDLSGESKVSVEIAMQRLWTKWTETEDGPRLDPKSPPKGQSAPEDGSMIINEPIMHLRDSIQLTTSRTNQFNFSNCRMSNCFDYTRCNSSGPIKIHILPPITNQKSDLLNLTGESNIIHSNILKIIRESVHNENDPDKACLFMLSEDTLDRDPLSKSFRSDVPDLLRPEYDFGMNHLVFNLYSGSWPNYNENDFAGFRIGAAIVAKASNSITHHRPYFDISIPLFSYLHPTFKEKFPRDELESPNRNRTFFLTFKGKRYVIGGGSDTRNSLYHLNNQNDVIMLTTCRHGKKWRDSIDIRCQEDDSAYEQYDFDDLMRDSIFCLTPRGRRLGSFRFLEALSYDCIPIVLSDGWVWPFDEIIDWSLAAIKFDESLVFHVPDMLRDLEPYVIKTMQENCRTLYQEYFSTTKKIVLTTLKIVEKRLRDHFQKVM